MQGEQINRDHVVKRASPERRFSGVGGVASRVRENLELHLAELLRNSCSNKRSACVD